MSVDMAVTAARLCVFCRQPGRLTNEDAFPRWLIAHVFTRGREVSQRWGDRRGMTGFTSKKQNVTVRRVCATCNNGWMSALEGAARPLLLPWIDGTRTRLLYDPQQTIATWAIKTTMMLQYTPMHQAGIVIPAAHYEALGARKTRPPDGVEVLIGNEREMPPGALFGIRGIAVVGQELTGLAPTVGRYMGYEATLIARGLVLKVLGHTGPPAARLTREVMIEPELGLTQIWPVQSSGGILLPA